jgi:exodeoxyribonuclease VII small subunit
MAEETRQKEKEQTLEESFKRLDEIAGRLEQKDLSLEESFQLYKEGMELLKTCSGTIDQVEKKMLQISGDGTLKEF